MITQSASEALPLDTPVYYYANQVYQYSFAKAIYSRLGGCFLVRNRHRKYRFLWHVRASQRNATYDPRFKEIPPIKIFNVRKAPFPDPGILISNSNSVIRKGNDRCHTIFMGHGTGDKRYGGNQHNLLSYDFHFISGPKHMEKLKDSGIHIPAEQCIPIGNPRFDDIVNRTIDKNRYREQLGIKDRQRKTILYAPTWQWGAGTLHQHIQSFIKEITEEYNLIVRPHYFDRKYILKYQAWTKFKRYEHVYFSNPANILTNDTMNDFAVSDMLISDTSSILYEYLITKNPIIVIDNHYKEGHQMPASMDIKTVAHMFDGMRRSGIKEVIDTAFKYHDRKAYARMLNDCFYFNDGRSLDRIIEFCQTLS